MQRRLPEDDQFVVPHNLYLTMFSPSSVNVLAFDPTRGADHARAYATKYASKPEKWYFLETVAEGLKNWLKARTIGVCMAFNRLLAFHVVRNTRPCIFVPACFLGKTEFRNRREPSHIQRCPDYPDPEYYLNYTQKYFFRHTSLRHLRPEAFTRYIGVCGDNVKGATSTSMTEDDTLLDEDDALPPIDTAHRNYDKRMEETAPGRYFGSTAKHVPGGRRRTQQRLGVSRVPFIEPIGATREDFYEAKLVLGLPWYCPEMPTVIQNAEGHNVTEWTFQCDLPSGNDLGGATLEPLILKLGPETVSFEVLCNTLERRFCEAELNCICQCCTEELRDSVCGSCRHAIGFHRCQNPNNSRQQFLWKKGTLHAGALDAQRVLFNLHRKLLPNAALEEKRKAYYNAGLIGKEESFRILQCILQERGTATYLNDGVEEVPGGETTGESSSKLTPKAMEELLNKRVAMMQDGHTCEGMPTDQFRVFSHIINAIETGQWLRLMVQASAGTGKSFLLNTIYLYCLVHGKRCKAAAPTGVGLSINGRV